MSIPALLLVTGALLLAVLTILSAVYVLVTRLLALQGKLAQDVARTTSVTSVQVVKEVVAGIGPLLAREIGDQIRGYPMAQLLGGDQNTGPDSTGGLDGGVDGAMLDWYKQATEGGSDDEFDDPTYATIGDPVDWSPEARVASVSQMPENLRGIIQDA